MAPLSIVERGSSRLSPTIGRDHNSLMERYPPGVRPTDHVWASGASALRRQAPPLAAAAGGRR
jgi:hypothetical protein